jgi:MoaA/NifB/PqqE/SkfB family radical SAM enzyme
MNQNNQAMSWRTAGRGDQAGLDKYLVDRLGATPKDLDRFRIYLKRREQQISGKDTLGFVYALTRFCNLACLHCGADASYRRITSEEPFELTSEQVVQIIEQVHSYASKSGMKPFFMFGGGEPTLRPDFKELLATAAAMFGAKNVGFCTNGTAMPPDAVLALQEYVGLIETSLDGLQNYHNQWRRSAGNHAETDPFRSTLALVDAALASSETATKLEVSSVVTRDNMTQLPTLGRFLQDRGLRNYSVHRAMPVGRMARHRDKIPTAEQYFAFILSMLPLCESSDGLSFHIHHSLESIYSALLLGRDIHSTSLLTGSGRHSIGIAWDGSVHFDPWSLVQPYSRLSPGNLLTARLSPILDDERSIMHLILVAQRGSVRCRACKMPCTGGMRFNAISDFLWEATKGHPERASDGQVVASVSQLDPACPVS